MLNGGTLSQLKLFGGGQSNARISQEQVNVLKWFKSNFGKISLHYWLSFPTPDLNLPSSSQTAFLFTSRVCITVGSHYSNRGQPGLGVKTGWVT